MERQCVWEDREHQSTMKLNGKDDEKHNDEMENTSQVSQVSLHQRLTVGSRRGHLQ
jgi:hypothetical protein